MKKATNSALMRIKNEKIILSLINKGPVSRAYIAGKTGLTKAAVTIIVDDLKQRGIVTEQMGKSATVGRNPVMLYLNHKAYYIIGVNITRQDIAVGITDLGGNTVAEDTLPICPPEEALGKIANAISHQLDAAGLNRERIYKLAVATPGPVDTAGGVILNPPNFSGWQNTAVAEELKKLTGFEVVMENVSSATAIAEKYFGAALGTESFMTLTVDEGIGSGIIINDSLFQGPCELGHTSVKYDGVRCECGNRGCLEKYASIPRILEHTGYKTWKAAVDAEDADILEKEAEYLSTAIISANNIFGFHKIVLCGDLTYKPLKITQLISQTIKDKVLTRQLPDICAGKVTSGYLIAAALAINDLFI